MRSRGQLERRRGKGLRRGRRRGILTLPVRQRGKVSPVVEMHRTATPAVEGRQRGRELLEVHRRVLPLLAPATLQTNLPVPPLAVQTTLQQAQPVQRQTALLSQELNQTDPHSPLVQALQTSLLPPLAVHQTVLPLQVLVLQTRPPLAPPVLQTFLARQQVDQTATAKAQRYQTGLPTEVLVRRESLPGRAQTLVSRNLRKTRVSARELGWEWRSCAPPNAAAGFAGAPVVYIVSTTRTRRQ